MLAPTGMTPSKPDAATVDPPSNERQADGEAPSLDDDGPAAGSQECPAAVDVKLIQGRCTREFLGRSVPGVALIITFVATVAVAEMSGQLQCVPIELSRAASKRPAYWVFSVGMSISGILILLMFPRITKTRRKWLLSHILLAAMALGLCTAGWICDKCHRQVHRMCCTLAFVSILGLAVLQNYRSPPLILTVLVFCVQEGIRLAYKGDGRPQLLGLLQWIMLISGYTAACSNPRQ